MTTQPTGFQRLPRLATAVMGGFGLLFVAAGPAAAQTCYPPGSAGCSTTTTTTPLEITVSDQTIAPGQSITFRATGFRPGTTVTFTLDGVVLGTAVADDEGVATLTTTLPAGTPPGRHTIIATGLDPAGQTRSVSLVITATGSVATGTAASGGTGGTKAGGSLAKTGAYAASTTAAGVGLVAGGVLLSRAAKRRKTSTA